MKLRPRNSLFTSLTLALVLCAIVQAAEPNWEPLIRRLVRDGHEESSLRQLFGRAEAQFDPEPMSHKLHELFEAQFQAGKIREIQEGLTKLGFDAGPVDGLEGWRTRRAILAFQRKYRLPRSTRISGELVQEIRETLDPSLKDLPKEEGPPVYKVVLKKERLDEAREFLDQYHGRLHNLAEEYGIPEEVAVGILTVETRVGKYLGEKKTFNTLSSMAVLRNLEAVEPLFNDETLTSERKTWLQSHSRQVSDWAYRELLAFLQYVQANQQDPLSLVGSIYGAIGLSQFMPSSVLEFGVDGDGDGRVDLFDLDDALHSMANYLRRNGWRTSTRSRKTQARVLYRYNRSRTYVNTVLAVADYLQMDGDR